ncbi:hypothetical protein EAH89_28220 [Roseomonas nepalensis]|uniref:Uncharacterized protein n=1 Tax=Muricoccus nepalensis TaxID=1854500 RepID=A0A502EVI6_9PROT|nr:hypothetical protein [Roseomonas nepalensis]TPG41935.1 hypothetical protein EAH89_28220 [Roseomonas nepalensis]
MYLSRHPHLNPVVSREAELFTDGRMTDAVLQGIASMRGLPLLIEAGAVPTAADRTEATERELIGAMSGHRVEAALYRTARLRLGMANQRPAAERRAAQAAAMSALNRARVALRKAERRLAAAQAAMVFLAV